MTLIDLINRFGCAVQEPPVRAPDYIDGYVRMPDLRAYTAQELRWMAEAQLEESEDE